MAKKKREYDVMLSVTMTRAVRVRAHSMKEAREVIYDKIPQVDQLGSISHDHVGEEFVIDVVRAGDLWHHERAQVDPQPHEGGK